MQWFNYTTVLFCTSCEDSSLVWGTGLALTCLNVYWSFFWELQETLNCTKSLSCICGTDSMWNVPLDGTTTLHTLKLDYTRPCYLFIYLFKLKEKKHFLKHSFPQIFKFHHLIPQLLEPSEDPPSNDPDMKSFFLHRRAVTTACSFRETTFSWRQWEDAWLTRWGVFFLSLSLPLSV